MERPGATLAETLVAELPRLGLAMIGVLAALIFQHFVVHRLIIVPAEAAGALAPWMLLALVSPELIVGLVTGWRLRSRPAAVMFAGMAAFLREGVQYLLAAAGEPGHAMGRPFWQLLTSTPVVAAGYLFALLLASTIAREQERAEVLWRERRAVTSPQRPNQHP